MKKVLLFIVGLISILIPTRIFAASAVIDWDLDRSVYVHRIINGEYSLMNMPYLTANGNVVYCIEPGKELEKGGTMTSTYNKSDTTVTRDIKKASLIGYYGYQKFGHNDPKYYMAAQRLMWIEMGASSAWFSYDREGNDVIDLSSYENEILRMMNNHDKKPVFDTSTKYLVGDEITLTDRNNVLSSYEVSSSSGNVRISGNNLIIKVLPSNNAFTLKRKSDNSKTIYYYKSGLQTVASFGFPYDVSQKYDIDTTYGKINLTKLDYDTGSDNPFNHNVSLMGAEYTIYNESGNAIDTRVTNEEGKLSFNNLPKGTYTIKETKASVGYNINEEEIKVVIDNDNIEVNIDAYEKVIKGMIEITKLLDDGVKNITTLEKNIEFGVFDLDNNLIMSNKTDENGKLMFELAYGKYLIRQLTHPNGITTVDDFLVDIKNNNEILGYPLLNRVIYKKTPGIVVLPRTGKKNVSIYLILMVFFLIIQYKYEKKIV